MDTRKSARSWSVAVWGLLFVHLVLSPLIFSSATVETFEFNKALLLRLTAILVAALRIETLLARGTVGTLPSFASLGAACRGLIRQPLALGVLLFLVSAALSTITSLSPRTSFFGAHTSYAGFLTLTAYAVLFVATRAACPTWTDGRRLLGAAVLAGGVVAAYALVQRAGFDPYPWAGVSQVGDYLRPGATLGHANLLAGYLIPTLPVSVAFAILAGRDRQWLPLAIFVAVSLLSLAALVATLSRGAWLGLAVMVLVVLAAWARYSRRTRTTWLLASGVVLLGVGLLLVFSADNNIARAARERIRGLADAGPRAHIWRASLAIFAERPLLGCGPDAFALAFASHRTPEYWAAEWGVTPTRGHNEVLHVLATQGLAGGAALLVLCFGVGRAILRAMRIAPNEARPVVIALGVGLLGYFVQGLFSFTMAGCGTLLVTCVAPLSRWGEGEGPAPAATTESNGTYGLSLLVAILLGTAVFAFNLPEQTDGALVVLLLAAVLGGIAVALWRQERSVAVPSRPARARLAVPTWARLAQLGVGGGACFIVYALVVQPFEASRACRHGELLAPVNCDEGLAELERATELDPGEDIYWTKLGSAALAAAEKAATPEEQLRRWQQGRGAFEQAVARVPANAYNHANLGGVLLPLVASGAASNAEVFAAYDTALAIDPANVYFSRDAATAAIQLGDGTRARRYLAAGLALYPAYGPLNAQMGMLQLREDRPADALPFLERAHAHRDLDGNVWAWQSVSVTLAVTLERLQRYDEALRVARAVVTRQPEWPEGRVILGDVLERLGRRDEAAAEYERGIHYGPTACLADLARKRLRMMGVIPPK